jgi:hypothetical protein
VAVREQRLMRDDAVIGELADQPLTLLGGHDVALMRRQPPGSSRGIEV